MQKVERDEVLVEFDCSTTNPTLIKLKALISTYLIPIRQAKLNSPNKINIYGNIENQTGTLLNGVLNKYFPSFLKDNRTNLVCSVVYQQSDQQPLEIPSVRTILIRECLPELINLNYQIETTFNEMESLRLMGELIMSLANLEDDKDISFFDQKSCSFEIRTGEKSTKDIWKNMLYQIHGMEYDKVDVIASTFPTVQSLIEDLGGLRKIQEITTVNQMEKAKKIKKNTIRKIEQAFLSVDPTEIME